MLKELSFFTAVNCSLCVITCLIVFPIDAASDTQEAYTQLLPYVTSFTGEVAADGSVSYGSTLTLANGSDTCKVKYSTIADNVKRRFEKSVSDNNAYGVYVDGDTLVTYYTETTTSVRKEE